MMHRTALFTLFTLALVSPAAAAEPVILWSDLAEGDTPPAVVSKLSVMPEVQRAKTKGGKTERPDAVDVNFKDGGLAILGERYGVSFHFEKGALTSVYLDAQTTCANDVYSRYARLMGVLSEKYPESAFPMRPQVDEAAFLDAKIKRLNGLQSVVTSAVSNGTTVAIVDVTFGLLPTPSVHGPQANLAWSIYRIQTSGCGGTGAERSSLRISYISAERWLLLNKAQIQERSQEHDEAKGRL